MGSSGLTLSSLTLSAEAFDASFERAISAMRTFGRCLWAAACSEYLKAHGRLPGSNRTSRLRKKRRDEVCRWYARQLYET